MNTYVAPVFANNTIPEDTVKAIYSVKLGLFTEWPEIKLNSTQQKFHFCILGKNPFSHKAISAIEDLQVKKRQLDINFYPSGLISKDALEKCHTLFISQSEKLRLKTLLKMLQNQPILTISDIDKFSHNGGMIALVENNNQVVFKINIKALKKATLSISSKIIELAVSTDDSSNTICRSQ